MTLPHTSPDADCTHITSTKSAPDWLVSQRLVPYPEAIETMEARVEAIYGGSASELVWLVEHPPLITSGTSAKAADLIAPDRFPVYAAGRGGQYTYHGPGQRVGYVMLDLRKRGQDLRHYIHQLEEWIIQTLNAFDIKGERRDGRVGIWVSQPDGREEKIAAIGVRVRRWITYHGIAINLAPELDHFEAIVPCGISGHGVTSIRELGGQAVLTDLDKALKTTFERVFPERSEAT